MRIWISDIGLPYEPTSSCRLIWISDIHMACQGHIGQLPMSNKRCPYWLNMAYRSLPILAIPGILSCLLTGDFSDGRSFLMAISQCRCGHHGNGVLRWLRWHRVMVVIASCVGRDDILTMPKIESWYVEFMFWFLPYPSMSIINVVNYYNPSAFSNILIIVLHHYNNYSFK